MTFQRLFLTTMAFVVGSVVTALILKPELRGWFIVEKARANAALYAPRDWNRVTASKLNISVFAFSDRNRNGLYDTTDKPLNRIAVRLTRPDGSTRIERSNINGFANFSMQRDGADADISQLSEAYEFELLPPPGWDITTNNAVQSSSFRAVRGAISGIGADTPPKVVGLAPAPKLRGRASVLSGIVKAESDRGAKLNSSVDDSGHFAFTLAPGKWSISQDEQESSRQVDVGYAPIILGTTVSAASDRSIPKRAITVGFDDIDRSPIEKIASGYAGLAWDYLLAVDNQFYKGPGYVNGLMSGSKVAYNSSGHPVSISALRADESFDFVGGYFSVAWHNAEGETLHIKAWRDTELVAEDKLTLSHLTPVYFQADYLDITRLQLETEHYWQFVVDDLRFALP
ncbi:hypothetical protein R0137_01160 [Congregibacter brevis]|uniref:SD-repeat containing protein B domain-containing protein n=1 Tax=Congregibacter brevis TaxID=3081201 RepID=A0ABZ0ICD2_9GAMM|nr:hypothetical protein R0137_01160 [Congregibacter sp. IMCC45268]